MTATDSPLVDVIAEVQQAHERKRGIRDGAIHCTCGWSESVRGMRSSRGSYATHQARAVLAAISEAGAVEWGVFRITDAPVMRPFDEAKFTTKTAAEVFIKLGFLERVAKTLEPRSRITGPWEVVG